jgi:hypothetical protein
LVGTNCSGNARNYGAVAAQLNNYQALLQSYEGNLATCNDGIDNDGDGFADTDGVPEEGLLADPKCDDTVDPLAQDFANRLGLQIGKTFTLQYVLNRLLLPSVPAACPDGWHEEDTTWIFE